jgi:hypothetical protein
MAGKKTEAQPDPAPAPDQKPSEGAPAPAPDAVKPTASKAEPVTPDDVLDASGAPVACTPKGERSPTKTEDDPAPGPLAGKGEMIMNVIGGLAIMLCLALVFVALTKPKAKPAPQPKTPAEGAPNG